MVQVIKLMSAVLVLIGLGSCAWRSQPSQTTHRTEREAVLRRRNLSLSQQSNVQQPQLSWQNNSSINAQQVNRRLLGQVVAVPSGDVIVVQVDQQQTGQHQVDQHQVDQHQWRLRLCGIDAPELTQPQGKTAQAALQKLLKGTATVKTVGRGSVSAKRQGKSSAKSSG
jgi:hypothetical protein